MLFHPGAIMKANDFFAELQARIGKFDLLCHPFYQAWSRGELTREDLREYALDYYEHVRAFPAYLASLAMRLEESELRRAVLANMADELGNEDGTGEETSSHAELWMDFAEGMGGSRNRPWHEANPTVRSLVRHFQNVAADGQPEEALAAFYAYESQVPRIAREKENGLRKWYGANDETCAYFTLHQTADVFHSQVWRQLLEKRLLEHPEAADKALAAGEAAAEALWNALDGIEARRHDRVAA
jgi:pyrroloquinoline-quinone synthase